MAVFYHKIQIVPRKYSILLFFLIFHLNIIPINSLDCKSEKSFNNQDCFNGLIIFDHKNLRASQFFTNKNGDLIIEYKDDSSPNDRIFYGLKKEGGKFFQTENGFYQYTSEGITQDESATSKRKHDTMSYFVLIRNEEDNTEKEYFFTIKPFKYLVELQDLNGEDNTRYTWNLKSFINYNDYNLFTNETFLIDIKNKTEFVITFVPKKIANEAKANKRIHKTFKLKSFSQEAFEELSMKEDDINMEYTLNSFSIDSHEMFAITYIRPSSSGNYYAIFYKYTDYKYLKDLKTAGNNFPSKKLQGAYKFYKPVWLKENYIAFMLYKQNVDGEDGNIFRLTTLKFWDRTGDAASELLLEYNITGINFNTNNSMNDLFKLDEKRTGFISIEGEPEDSERKLNIFLFHFSANYTQVKMRRYFYDLADYIFIKDLSGYFYNGLLVLGATSVLKKEEMGDEDWANYFSLFMVFGYPNGTDSTKDISFLLEGSDNYDSSIDFYSFLCEDFVIENNIFGFFPEDKIKIISIPDEISIFKENEDTQIESNSFIFKNAK